MNGRKRKVQIKFYVTEEERALIEQKMKLVPTDVYKRQLKYYIRVKLIFLIIGLILIDFV